MLIDGKCSDILRRSEVKGSRVQREGIGKLVRGTLRGMNYKAVLPVEENLDLSVDNIHKVKQICFPN